MTGTELAKYRKALGLTQEAMREHPEIDVSVRTWKRWESAHKNGPPPRIVAILNRIYGE